MSDPIDDCAAGRISPHVAIARMLLAGADAASIRARAAAGPGAPAIRALSTLLAGRDAALDGLAAEIRAMGGDHTRLAGESADPVQRIAAFFDRAASHSPEAGVALYSLGDPALLAAATAEIADWLTARGLLRPGADVLDLGCGIGRLAPVLAAQARSVLGLDVSANMVAEARRRAAAPNVRFAQADGHSLDAIEPDSLDLILAVDSFPYIVAAGPGVLRRHLDGAARALRPGGALVVLNFSYRGDPGADATDARSARGLSLEVAGEAPFRIWDGTAYVWRRPALEIVHLADRPDLALLAAEWIWGEFGHDLDGTREEFHAMIAGSVNRSGPGQTFIALVDGAPAATASLARSDLDERPDLSPWLAGVFVLPEHRGRGLAAALVRRVEQAAAASGFTRLWLYTATAEEMYRRLGWRTAEIVPRERRPPVTLMERTLP